MFEDRRKRDNTGMVGKEPAGEVPYSSFIDLSGPIPVENFKWDDLVKDYEKVVKGLS